MRDVQPRVCVNGERYGLGMMIPVTGSFSTENMSLKWYETRSDFTGTSMEHRTEQEQMFVRCHVLKDAEEMVTGK